MIYNYDKSLKVEQHDFGGKDFQHITLKEFEEVYYANEEVVNGFITRQMFYLNPDFTEMIIDVPFTYSFDSNGMVDTITKILNFIDEDDSVGWVKDPVIDKLTQRRKLSLLKKRRNTVREQLEASILGLLQFSGTRTAQEVLALGAGFILAHKTALDNYVAVGHPQVVQEISVATDSWLDEAPAPLGGATIRQYMMGALSA